MKQKQTPLAWMLTAAVLLLLVLVACGPATPPPDETAPEDTAAEDTAASLDGDEVASQLPEDAPAEPEPVELEGATVTDSGLQYLEVTAGDGATPTAGDIVTMHFIASLPDGTQFGDSYSQGEPIQIVFGREQLFPGWEEGVGLMQEGGEAKLAIPPELAFGEAGFAGIVPPNSFVIIDVELISVEKPPQAPAVDAGDLTTTDSGLQYADLEEGSGDEVVEGDIVSTNFSIWLEDGTFVASSEGREPLAFTVGNGDVVFPGWEEGVTGMQAGGTRYLVVPADLGLGEQGGGDIPPGATLLMEIELVSITQPAVQEEVDPDDFTETESGLKYFDIVEGDGEEVTAGQTVSVHYSGWLEDGTKFDSSVDRGTPFTLTVGTGQVIAGWDEGLQGMRVGGKRQLVIPAELGYGAAGAGQIPPGATLIFDVEVLEIIEE